MTVLEEEHRALLAARDLLHDLLDPRATPRTPLPVRERARGVLRHYPFPSMLEERYRELIEERNRLWGWQPPGGQE